MSQNLHHILFTMGNPLLDISAHVGEEVLTKYSVKPGEAILAEEKHLGVYDDLIENYKVSYIAGGSTQNTARVFVWMTQSKNSAVYCGGVGKDKHSKLLKEQAEIAGVDVQYHYDEKVPTGTCAVLVCGKERTLITNLSAANHYKQEHLLTKEMQAIMTQAKFYYSAGYFLTVSVESMITMGKHACETNKVFMTNLAAAFIPMFFKDQLLSVLPYSDYLFGNKDEVEALAKAMGFDTSDVAEVAKRMSLYTKLNTKRDRVVVFTQGADDVVVAINGEVQLFKVPKLEQDMIVDMNGAGDAFCGGFISQLVLDKSLEECVRAGNYAAQTIIQRDGCTFPEKPSFK
jgi:adenosine kinase